MTYLLTPPPAMPLESLLDAPPVRSQAEVNAALAGSEEVPVDRAGEFSRRIGLASGSAISFRHGPLELAFGDRQYPIIRNFSKLALHDESYWKLIGNPAGLDVLATSLEDGEPTPQLWTKEVGEGRVFVSIPGHYSWTFDDPLFRILLLRGIAWAAHEPVDRFNDLVTPGARMSR